MGKTFTKINEKKLTFLCFQWALANLLSLKSMGSHLNESHSWSSSDYPKIGNSQKALYRYRWIIPCVKASLICVFGVKFTPIAVFYPKPWVQSTRKGSDIDEEFANTISLSCYYRVIWLFRVTFSGLGSLRRLLSFNRAETQFRPVNPILPQVSWVIWRLVSRSFTHTNRGL